MGLKAGAKNKTAHFHVEHQSSMYSMYLKASIPVEHHCRHAEELQEKLTDGGKRKTEQHLGKRDPLRMTGLKLSSM